MNQIQNLKQNRFGHWRLAFGIHLGFVILNLRFEYTYHFSALKKVL
jgi:hypothetical protein